MITDPLTEQQQQILAMERRWWKLGGSKDTAVRDELGLSPVRYNQLLLALLEHPAAVQAEPILVRRLQRIASARAQQRAHRGRAAS